MAYENDIIMRQVRDMTRMLAKILFGKNTATYEYKEEDRHTATDSLYARLIALVDAGKINEAEAGKKCKMNHARFRREAVKRLEERGETKQRKDGYGTHFPDNFREVCDLVLAGKITATMGAERCGVSYTTFYSWIQREKAER